jgi:glycosyltransferase involved in cell wall biosynthesis
VKTLTIICPVFNEEAVIRSFYKELKAVVARLEPQYVHAILFVVDRCDDGTLSILKDIAGADAAVQILALSARFGHQMSLLAGIDHAMGDVLIMMDSDLQHPPDLIPELVAEYEKGFEIVHTLREDSREISWAKRTSSRLFYRMINQISDVEIRQNAADFRLVSRRVADVFRSQIRERNQFLRGLFGWVGFNATAVPFRVRARGAGRTKYSVRRMVRFGIDGVVSFSKSPLQAATIIGFAFAFFGFGVGLVTTVQSLNSSRCPSGWATLIVLISMFSGTQLICLGIIGEYLGAVFDEVKQRPHYLIESAINVPVINRPMSDEQTAPK